MTVQFYNFKAQYAKINQDVQSRLDAVLAHGRYVMGPEVFALEHQLADRAGVSHCIGVSSGTDALLLAMLALGVGPGDEVITSPFSFVSVVEMAVLIGAKPVFVDIDPDTYNLDPKKLNRAITNKTKVIVPVSLYGQPADYTAINDIATRHGLPVIDDAAQSIGSTHQGRQTGGLATITCTSFYPTKPLGCYGDGGACFTNDDALAKRLREARDNGQSGRYEHTSIGMTGRLDSMQAAVLLAKLTLFDQEVQDRQRIADCYNKHLQDRVKLPYIAPANTSVYAQYTIEVPHRESCRLALENKGIPTAVHYPTLLSNQPVYRALCDVEDGGVSAFPVAQSACEHVLSIPMHPYLTQEEIEFVSDAIIAAVELHDEAAAA